MKESIRNHVLEKRNSLNKEEVMQKSRAIKHTLFSLPRFKQSKTVMFYASKDNEVFTHDMIKEALREKTVVLPVTRNNIITASQMSSFEELEPAKFDILEPEEIKPVNPEQIDVVIVPGIAFDKEGNRVGYGLGCYDNFLKKTKAKKIGICFDAQLRDKVPCDDSDVRMDIIITEKQII